ncbi:hypothetical protein ACFQ58_11730 [Agromyces sp. NPDC056523]|uniref:hypothetical protein n=1 Tax=Agromyces sp. NPDC056523 TaxID=3345850 RepID=UPI00366F24A3
MMHELLENLRRRPHGPAELVADGLRAVGLVCIVIAGIGWGPMGAVSLAFVTGAMLLPRALAVRPGFDIAYCVIALMSVWSSVTDLYVTVKWWDLPMHFLMNGLAAAVCYILLERLGVVAKASTLPRPLLSTTIVTTAIGLSLAAFWEMFEWFGKTFLDETIYVGYRDTIGDIVAGGLGSLLAGLLMPVLVARPRRAESAGSSRAGATPHATTPPASPDP